MTNINPEDDGVTHINIWSKGETELGRLLSNFARTPFYHPRHGRFNSVEGFWYWMKTGCIHDELKDMHGYMAKKMGQQFPVVHNPNFEREVANALRLKIIQNPRICELLANNALPFKHYYNYGGHIVDRTEHHDWQIKVIEGVIPLLLDIA